MSENLCSVGLDVGTTTTQMILSRITVENRSSGFTVPRMEITDRQVVYQSPVWFTPLLGEDRVDAKAIRDMVEKAYREAGITPEDVDTGAIIITGETSRKENARAVLEQIAGYAGEFVVATAGPDLESRLAAKGAGATQWSEKTGARVLHMDIGGGTSNLALIEDGKIVATGCMNVGGRLLKLEENGRIHYVSPVLQGLTDLQVGEKPDLRQLEEIAGVLTQGLEMAAGLIPPTDLLEKLWTKECGEVWPLPRKACVISFSGGVADCIDTKREIASFGDIGPVLGKTIRESRLCRGEYMLGRQTIRATVIGAGCHSTQLSGSTVFYRNVALPQKNLPVVVFDQHQQENPEYMAQKLQKEDAQTVVIALCGYGSPSYEKVRKLAETLCQVTKKQFFVALETDMAKALGHQLCLLLPPQTPCLCIDRVRLEEGSFLDIGQPVGPALPVVIKTLILSQG